MADGKVIIETELDDTGAKQGMQKLDGTLSSSAGKLQSTGKILLGTTAAVVGLGGGAVKTAADFDTAMSQVAATSGKTVDELNSATVSSGEFQGSLEDLAIYMGSTTAFSATEAAEALNYLALAGYDAQTMANTLPTVLNLAAAGNMDLASASDMVTDALAALSLQSTDAEMLVNQMAKTAASSNTSVAQLGEAILTVGGTAKELAGGTTELNAVLGTFANVGIKGAEGGTKLRNIITKMASPTKDAVEWMAKLNFSFFDAEGNLKPLNESFGELNTKLGSLTQEDRLKAMSDLFNVRDIAAVSGLMSASATSVEDMSTALSVLEIDTKKLNITNEELENIMNQVYSGGFGEGEAAIQNFTDTMIKQFGLTQEQAENMFNTIYAGKNSLVALEAQIDTAQEGGGAASKMAKTQLDNLNGAFTLLKSAVEGAAISIGHVLIPYIKQAAESITQWVTKFNELDDSQKEKIVKIAAAIAGVVGSIGAVLVILGTLIKAVNTVKTTLLALKTIWTAISTAFVANPISLAVIAIAAAVAVLVAAFKHLWDTNDEFRTKMIEGWENIKSKFTEFFQHITDKLNELGFDFQNFKEVVSAIWEEFCNLLAPIFEGIWQYIQDTLSTALDVISGIFDFFIDIFKGDWEGAWNDILGIFQSIWEGLGKWFENILNTLKGVADVVLGWFDTNWNDFWQGIVDFFVGVWDGVKEFFSDLWTGIKDTAVNIWSSITDFFTQTIPQTIENIGNWFKELPGKIAYGLGYALGAIAKWCSDTKANLSEAIPRLIEDVGNWFKELPGKIKTWLDTTITNIKTWKDDTIKHAKETGKQFIDNVINTIKELPGKIWTWLTQTISKVITFRNDMISKAKTTASEFATSLVNGLANLPSKMLEIGKNIVSGLTNGIKNAWTNFTSTVSGLVDNFVGGVKDGLGIHSPSKIFKQIGQYCVEGLDQGLQDIVGNTTIQDSLIAQTEGIDEDLKKISTNYSFTPSFEIAGGGMTFDYDAFGGAISNALSKVGIYMDSTVCGKLVAPSVNREFGVINTRRI